MQSTNVFKLPSAYFDIKNISDPAVIVLKEGFHYQQLTQETGKFIGEEQTLNLDFSELPIAVIGALIQLKTQANDNKVIHLKSECLIESLDKKNLKLSLVDCLSLIMAAREDSTLSFYEPIVIISNYSVDGEIRTVTTTQLSEPNTHTTSEEMESELLTA